MTLAHELKTVRGKKTFKEEITFDPGETVDLSEFGIAAATPMERAIEGMRDVADRVGGIELVTAHGSARIEPR